MSIKQNILEHFSPKYYNRRFIFLVIKKYLCYFCTCQAKSVLSTEERKRQDLQFLKVGFLLFSNLFIQQLH